MSECTATAPQRRGSAWYEEEGAGVNQAAGGVKQSEETGILQGSVIPVHCPGAGLSSYAWFEELYCGVVNNALVNFWSSWLEEGKGGGGTGAQNASLRLCQIGLGTRRLCPQKRSGARGGCLGPVAVRPWIVRPWKSRAHWVATCVRSQTTRRPRMGGHINFMKDLESCEA